MHNNVGGMYTVYARSLRLPQLSNGLVLNAMHGMQTRSSDENSVCLSARLSVCQTYDL